MCLERGKSEGERYPGILGEEHVAGEAAVILQRRERGQDTVSPPSVPSESPGFVPRTVTSLPDTPSLIT